MTTPVRKRALALVACLQLAFAAALHAATPGRVTCVVHDPDHRPVPGALVTLRAAEGEWARSATTGADGEVRLQDVPPGNYTLDVELAGFEPAHLEVTVASAGGPVLHVQLRVAAVSQAVRVAATPQAAAAASVMPATVVDRSEVASTPGASRTNSLSAITSFVPGAYVTHDQLHVRGGHQVSWLLDGVPVPNTNIGNSVGPQFDPKDADYIEAFRGAYDAEYGDRTYAVFNVVPRTGFERDNDVEVVASGGNYWQTNDEVSVGGHTERFAYYASVAGNRSSLGLQPAAEAILHDRQGGLSQFTTLVFNANPRNQLRVATSVRGDAYQVPNTPETQSAGLHDVERESDVLATATWTRSFKSGALATVSPFYHRSATRFDGGGDASVRAADHHASRYAGAQATLGATAGRHSWEAGFYGYLQRDTQALDVRFDDGSQSDVSVREGPAGSLWSVFVQDTFRATPWLSATAGLRHTRFSGELSEHATSPRAGVSIRIPPLGWVVRGFYGRYYQEPPLGTVSGPILGLVTSLNLGWVPLHGERDEEVQAGVTVPVGGWTIDANVFRTRARNFFDHNSLGNSNVFFPVTIDRAHIHGVEVAVRSPKEKATLRVHAAYSYQVAEGVGAVSGGLIDFSPPSGVFLLDHDQRHTLSAGIEARLPRRLFASGSVYYGSGFPDAGGPARLPGHATADVTGGRAFSDRLSVSVTALNVANTRVLIDNSPTFGGRHFNHPREIYAEARWRFRY